MSPPGQIRTSLDTREEKAERLKRSLPLLALGAVALALVLSVVLPRFMAGNATTCAVIGGLWQVTSALDQIRL